MVCYNLAPKRPLPFLNNILEVTPGPFNVDSLAQNLIPYSWNGKPYDPTNPLGHVQYPLIGAGLLGPNCPLGYERRIPGILIETFYIGAEDFGPGPFGLWGDNGPDVPSYILANGDTTGYGLQ